MIISADSQAVLLFEQITTFIFDFDGVLTDNHVYVGENGEELVRCNRGDSLALNALKRVDKRLFILSSEENPVVKARAVKLHINCISGVTNKAYELERLATDNAFDLLQTCYVGNDLNDLHAMLKCGVKVCPADSHPAIKSISDFVLKSRGGHGVVRELVEAVMRLDLVKILYSDRVQK